MSDLFKGWDSGQNEDFPDWTEDQDPDDIHINNIPDLSSLYQAIDAILTELAALTDPDADKYIMWDDSEDGFVWSDGGSLTTEEIQDIVGAMLTGNTETGITVTYEDGDGTIDFVVSGGGGYTQEEIEDFVGAMLSGNTETGITVTYQDGDSTIDFVLDTEYIQDLIGAMFSGNTETGISATYQDADGTIDLVLSSEWIQDLVGAMFSGNTETGITATYQDGDGTIDLVVSGGSGQSDLEIRNIKDFYSTTWDAALTAAITDIVTTDGENGGIIYFPPGVYEFEGSINITNNGITLMGAGMGASQQYYTATNVPAGASVIKADSTFSTTAPLIYFSSRTDGNQIRDLMLHGNGRAKYLIYAVNAIQLTCKNIIGVDWAYSTTTYSYAVSLQMNDATGTMAEAMQYFENCHFLAPNGSNACGLDLNSANGCDMCESRFVHCTFSAYNDSFATSGPHVVRIGSCDHIQFIGCLFQAALTPGESISSNFCSFYVDPTDHTWFPHNITFIGSPHYGGIYEGSGWSTTTAAALLFYPYYTGDSQPVPPYDYRNSSSYTLTHNLVGGFTDRGQGLGIFAPWTTLSYNTGWTTVSGYTAMSYMRDAAGMVHLRGAVYRSSGSETVIGTLPTGFQPGGAKYFIQRVGANPGDTGEIVVNSSGQISYTSGTVTSFVSLDGICFSGDN